MSWTELTFKEVYLLQCSISPAYKIIASLFMTVVLLTLLYLINKVEKKE